jgi:CRISPR-associated protein Csm4
MIKDYLAQIELKTNLYTPILGDTVFGMICWMLLYQEGETTLSEFLEESNQSPQAIFSSAFPKGHLPLPNIPKITSLNLSSSQRKKLKKEQWISVSKFLELRNNFSLDEFYKFKLQEYANTIEENPFEKVVSYVPHNSINRLTGMVEETGGLYFSKVLAKPGSVYDIYISVEEKWDEQIKQAFYLLADYGYGKDSSIGGGGFQVISYQTTDLFSSQENYTHGLALSPFVPSYDDPIEINYELFTRFGKLGVGFITQENLEYSYLKKPFLLFKHGTFCSNQTKGYLGQLVHEVHRDKRVKHNGYTRILGFNLKESP